MGHFGLGAISRILWSYIKTTGELLDGMFTDLLLGLSNNSLDVIGKYLFKVRWLIKADTVYSFLD